MSIKIEQVNYTYGAGTAYEIQALKDVSLKVDDGEFVDLSGIPAPGNLR